jgi:hypothetical protein
LQGSTVMHQSGAETLVTEEPYALIAHVRICGGAGWATTGSTRQTALVLVCGVVPYRGDTFHDLSCGTATYAVDTGVVPAAQHHALTKHARHTQHSSRFHTMVRPRVYRLGRRPLAFSNQLGTSIGARKSCLCPSTLPRAVAFPVYHDHHCDRSPLVALRTCRRDQGWWAVP